MSTLSTILLRRWANYDGQDLEIFDVETNDVNGGSFRTYVPIRAHSLTDVLLISSAFDMAPLMGDIGAGNYLPLPSFVSRQRSRDLGPSIVGPASQRK